MIHLKREITARVWHVIAATVIASLLFAGLVAVGAVVIGKLSEFAVQNRQLAQVNRRSIRNNGRLDRLDAERARAQSREGTTAAVLRALRAVRSCARDPRCRRRNPGVAQVARSISRSRLPTRAPRRRSGGGSSGGATTGGGGTTTPPSPSPRPQGPTQTGRRPQSTTRPRAPAPAPANPPAARPPAAPPAQNSPAPTPQSPVPVPTVSVPPTPTPPPVPPVVPPVQVPVPIQVCAPPLIVVNCRDPQSGAVRSAEAEADPASSSGRGNADDPLCDRLKLPCDDAGNPVFPAGLIRLP